MNAWLHGIYAADSFLLEGESRALFLLQRESFVRALKPADEMELMFAEQLAMAKARLLRLQRLAQESHVRQVQEIRSRAANDLETLQHTLEENFDEHVDYSRWFKEISTTAPGDPDETNPFDAIEDGEELKKQALPLIRMLQQAKHKRLSPAIVQYEQIDTPDGLQRMDWFVRTTQRLELSFSRWMRELQKYRALRLKQQKGQPEETILAPLDFLSDPERLLEQVKQELEREQTRRTRDKAEFPPNEPTGEQSTANEVNTTTSANEVTPTDPDKSDREARREPDSSPETPLSPPPVNSSG